MKIYNLALNSLLFCLGLFLSGTAILLEWRLPHGRSGRVASFLGMGRHDWAEVHWWLGLLLVVGVILHLALHWRWIWKIAAKQKRAVVLTLAIAIAVVLGFFAFFPTDSGFGRYDGHEEAAQLP